MTIPKEFDFKPGRALIALSDLSWHEASRAFEACYAGYLIAIRGGPDDLRKRVEVEDIDRDASYALFDGDRPLAIGLVARRSSAMRLAALAVVPNLRGMGCGRMMLERLLIEAAQRQDATAELEVLEANTSAMKLYQSLGFQSIDRLLGFELHATAASQLLRPLVESSLATLAARLLAEELPGLPWQLAGQTVAKLSAPSSVLTDGEGAFALVNLTLPDVVQLRLIYTEPAVRGRGRARRLVSAIAAKAAGRPVRVPQLISATLEPFASKLGFIVTPLPQQRMILSLSPQSLPATINGSIRGLA